MFSSLPSLSGSQLKVLDVLFGGALWAPLFSRRWRPTPLEVKVFYKPDRGNP